MLRTGRDPRAKRVVSAKTRVDYKKSPRVFAVYAQAQARFRNTVSPSKSTLLCKKAILVMALLLIPSSVLLGGFTSPQASATPSNGYLNFQARIKSNTGAVIADGYYNIEFKLYNVLTDANTPKDTGACTYATGTPDPNCVWTERYYDSNGVTAGNDNRLRVVNGYFSVNLGSQTSLASVDFSQQLYLVMNIGGTTQTATPTFDGEMTPRIQMTAIPLALLANNVNSGNTTGASSNSANTLLQSGNTTGATSNSGSVTLQSGNVTSGNSGNILIDAGSASGTKGTISVGTAKASAISIGRTGVTTTNVGSLTVTQTLTANGGIVVAASQSISLTGGNTASRPGSPTEGMVYFDTTTKQLLTYANGKWQADRTDAVIVAASNSSQADKDVADYVATGSGDNTVINSALTAGSGKKVILLAGTYTLSGSISVPNNTTLTGIGMGTLITIPNALNANFSAIVNTDTTTGTNITIRDLQLDGNKSNQSGSFGMTGIALNNMGSTTTRPGALISNVQSNNWYSAASSSCQGGYGICLINSNNNMLVGNSTQANTNYGIYLTSSTKNTLSNNIAIGNARGLYLFSSSNNTLTGNISQSSTSYGIILSNSTNNTVTGNVSQGSTLAGIYLFSNSNYNVVSNNKVHDTGGATINDGIYLSSTSIYNTITGNNITDTSCTTNCYAININDSSSDFNYIANNTYNTTAGTDQARIRDIATNTRYASQLTASTILQSGSSYIKANASSSLTGTGAIAATATLTGTSTKFTTELQAGDRVTVNAETRTVTGIVSDTSVNVDTAFTTTASSQTITRLPAVLRVATSAGANTLVVDSVGAVTVTTSNTSALKVVGTAVDGFSFDTTTQKFVVGSDITNATARAFYGKDGIDGGYNYTIQAMNTGVLTLQADANVAIKSNTGNVVVGTSDTTGTLFVVDTKTGSGDPTGVNGGIYYNSNAGKFRCYQNGAWVDCISIAIASTLQSDYTAATASPTPEIIVDGTRKGLDIQDANTTIGATETLLAVRASATSSTLGNGLFVVNASGKVGIATGSTSTTPTLSYDLSFGQNSTPTGRTIGVEDQTTVATAGNALTVSSGKGNTTGAGGLLTLQAGQGGATGTGGGITLTTGAGGSTSGNSGVLTLQSGSVTAGSTAGNIVIDVGASSTGAPNIGIGATTNSVAKTITIGSSNQTGQILLGQSTADTASVSILSGVLTSASQSVNIANGNTNTAGTRTVNILNGGIGTGTTGTVAIGTGGASGGTVNVTIGSTGGSSPTTTIQGGGSSTAISLVTATSGTINIGNNAVSKTINIGSANAVVGASTINIGSTSDNTTTQAITIGSNANFTHTTAIQGGNGATAITLTPQTTGQIVIGAAAGTGNITLGSSSTTQTVFIGAGAGISNVNIANGTTAGSTVTIAGNATGSGNTDTINLATGNAAGTGNKTVNIASGTPTTGINTVLIGSQTNASVTTLQGGTGTTAIRLLTGSGGKISIGDNSVASTVQIGNTGGAVTQSINIGTNATGSSTNNVLIGSTVAGTTTLQNATVIALNAAAVTSNATTLAVFDSGVTTLNLARAATVVTLGATTGTTTIQTPTLAVATGSATANITNGGTGGLNIRTADSASAPGAVLITAGAITGGTGLTGGSISINTATGSGTNSNTGSIAIDSGAPSGTGTPGTIGIGTANSRSITLGSNTTSTVVKLSGGSTTGGINLDAANIFTNIATQTLLNTNVTNLSFAGAATTLTVGATTGTLTLNNPTIIGQATSQNLFNTVATTLNIGGAASINLGAAAGTTTVQGGLTLTTGKTLTVNGDALTDLTGTGLTVVGNALTVDSTTAAGFFKNGGNAFTSASTLGNTGNFDLNVITNNTARLIVRNSGGFEVNSASDNTLYLQRTGGAGNEANIVFNTNGSDVGQIRGISGGGIRFTNSTATTEWARFTSAGSFILGNGATNASPAVGLLQATGGSGTNIAGAAITVAGGQGTGTGVGGNILFQYAPAGLTGASLNALQTACTISGTNGSLSCPGAGSNSERFGSGTTAGANGTAIGYQASANTLDAIVGYQSSGNQYSSVLGSSSTSDNGGIAVGYSTTSGQNAVALGYSSYAYHHSIAIGSTATSNNFNGTIALGEGATGTAANQLVIGGSSYPIQNAYIGNGVTNATPSAIKLQATSGSGTNITGAAFTLAAGQGTGTGVSGNIVFQYAPAGASGASLNALQTACSISGTNGSLSCPGAGTSSDRFGTGSVASGNYTLAVGYDAQATGYQAVAVGTSARGTGDNSTAVGYNATTASYSTAIGNSATSGGLYSVAVGTNASSAGYTSTAIGNGASSGYTDSIALGYGAAATAANQLVIGASGNGIISQAFIGNGVTSTTPQAITLQATGGSGTNIAGAAFTLAGGKGTGTGVGGNLVFQTAKAGSSGASANSLQTVLTLSGTNGSATFKNSVDSTAGFQVQNAAGMDIINVDTTNTNITVGSIHSDSATTNLLTNPSVETNATNWSATFNANNSGAQDATASKYGQYSYKGTRGVTTYGDVRFARYSDGVSRSGTYTVSAWVNSTASAMGPIGIQVNTFSTSATTTRTVEADGTKVGVWQRVATTFTITTPGTIYFDFYSDPLVTGSAYIDGIQLEQLGHETSYVDGSLGNGYAWTGTAHASTSTRAATSGATLVSDSTITSQGGLNVNGAGLFKNATNSTTAFQIQNAAGTSLLNADTTVNKLTVNQGTVVLSGGSVVPGTPTLAAGASTGGTLSGSAGITYYYKVTAILPGGETITSAEAAFNGQRFSKITTAGAPTVAVGAATGLTGTYSYKVTFVTANGETSAGTVSGNVTVTNQKVSLTAIPTGATGTIARNIYRTDSTNTGLYKLVTTIADNSTTTYTDSTADASRTFPAPSANTATVDTNNITVTFSTVTNATGYRIYRGTSSNGQTAYQSTSSSPFTDTGTTGTAATAPTSSGLDRLGVGNGTPTANLDVLGTAKFQVLQDSTTAFQVLNATGSSVLNVDSLNNSLTVGLPNGASMFAPKADYGTQLTPLGVATADFNNDGKADFATANQNGGSLSILLNNGNGTYAAAVNYTANTQPDAIAVADFNRDGYMDVVVVNGGSSNVSVFINKGDGTFNTKADYSVAAFPGGVTTGDFNKDGYPDIATADANGTNKISVLLATSSGTSFATTADYTAGTNASGITSGDVNGDGAIDIISGNPGANTASVFINSGTGTFAAKVDYGGGQNSGGVALGDLDKDGDLDLVIGNGGGTTVSVLLNNGNGTYATKVDYSTVSGAGAVILTDLNKDGRLDIAATGTASVSVLMGLGNGTFTTRTDYVVGGQSSSITSGDFDGNGSIDIATSGDTLDAVSVLLNRTLAVGPTATPTLSLYSNSTADALSIVGQSNSQLFRVDGSGNTSIGGTNGALFDTQVAYATGSAPTVVTSADFNNDGITDLATSNGSSDSFSLLLGNGNGTFNSKVDVSTGTGTNVLYIASSDVNRDGKMDVIVTASGTGKVSVFLGNGNGTFAAKSDYTTNTSPIGLTLADLNKDGYDDIIVNNSGSTNMSVFINTGSGTFGTKTDYTTGSSPIGIATGDFNKDGNIDVVVVNGGSDTISVFFNTGSGTFGAKTDYATASGAGRHAVVADFNKDGAPDIAVNTSTTDGVSVFINNGTGTFAAKVDYPAGVLTRAITAADVNNDGIIDLIVSNFTSNTISVMTGRGNGTFNTKVDYTVGTNPRGLVAFDADKDGDLDIAVVNNGGANLSVLLNTSVQNSRLRVLNSTGTTSLFDLNNNRLTVNTNTTVNGTFVAAARAGSGQTKVIDIQNVSATSLLSVSTIGEFISRNSTDSASAFQIQNANGMTLQRVDTINYQTRFAGDLVVNGLAWTARVASGANNWTSVAYGNGTYVAVSNTAGTGNEVMTSPDGINWTPRTSAVSAVWTSVTYGNGLFVAVSTTAGTGNEVMTSPDGIVWTARTSAVSAAWRGITYGNGVFVAVSQTSGTGNEVMTSPDGITWTARTSSLTNIWSAVTYGNGLFVAVADGSLGTEVMTSPDGVIWTTRTTTGSQGFTSVTYGGGVYVAVGRTSLGNSIYSSPDGTTWTSRTDPTNSDWGSVTYGNGLFAAVSTSGGVAQRIMTSSDGTNWTARNAPIDVTWNGITYGGGQFVAVGLGASSSTKSVMTAVKADGTGSTTAFQVQNANGLNGALTVDTLNGSVILGAQTDATAHNFASSCGCLINSAAGTFGSDTARTGAYSSAIFNGKLYVATKNTDTSAIYRYDGGTTWAKVSDTTLGKIISGDTANIDASVLTVFNGKLYAGTQTGSDTGAVYAYDGTTWSLVQTTRGTFDAQTLVDGVSSLAVWNGHIYVYTQEVNKGAVYRYDGNGTWTLTGIGVVGKLSSADVADADGGTLISYNGNLWAGTITASATGGRVEKFDGAVWTMMQATAGTFATGVTSMADVTSMAVFNGALYIGVAGSAANTANIYMYKGGTDRPGTMGDDWIRTTSVSGKVDASDAADVDSIPAMTVYNGRLYAGSATGTTTGALYEYTNTDTSGTLNQWTKVNTTRGTFGAQTTVTNIDTLVPYNNTLYIGTETASIGSVYTWSKTSSNSYALKFASDSANANLGSISFTGNQQSVGNASNTGSFLFSNGISTTTGAYDLAEDYPTRDDSLVAGNIVILDQSERTFVKKSDGTKYDNKAVGIYSTNPALRLSQADASIDGARAVPIALAGRVPVKVTNENGSIKTGDYITTSSTPGYGMKATEYGQVIGKAMEDFNGTDGSVMVFLNVTQYQPSVSEMLTSNATVTDLTVTGTLTAQKVVVEEIKVSGTLVVNGDSDLQFVRIHKDLEIGGKIITTGDQPTITVDSVLVALQGQEYNPVATITGTDVAGVIKLVTSTTTQNDLKLKIKFSKKYTTAPSVVISALGRDSATTGAYIDSIDGEYVTIAFVNTPENNKTYQFNYQIIQSVPVATAPATTN